MYCIFVSDCHVQSAHVYVLVSHYMMYMYVYMYMHNAHFPELLYLYVYIRCKSILYTAEPGCFPFLPLNILIMCYPSEGTSQIRIEIERLAYLYFPYVHAQ